MEHKQLQQNTQGITLLEVIVSVAIFVIATGIVSSFVIQGSRVQDIALGQNTAITEARRGVETMVREIREIQIADNGAFPLITADDFEFTFYGDIDKDSSVERVRYFLDGTDFKKGTIEPRTNPVSYYTSDEVIVTLSRYVRNTSTPLFTYYNGDWPGDVVNNPLPTPADITDPRFVNVYLKINVKPNTAPTDFDLTSDVQIRSLKDNL